MRIPPPAAALPLIPSPQVKRVLAIIALNVLAWTVISALGALTSLNDDLRYGRQGEYLSIFCVWFNSSLVLAAQSLLLYLLFSYRPALIATGMRIALGYGVMLLVLMPPQMLFLLKLVLAADGPGLSWGALERQVDAFDRFASLIKFTSTSAVYFAVVGLKAWQHKQANAREAEQARADNLAIRLELERQHSLALRAQLEPHFMFNAMGAISALVRSGDKALALDGIHCLGQLLRYALAAADKHWVTLADEMAFLDQYLYLQGLRYGARLRVSIEGLDDSLADSDMPPLLLQPLLENALRHDLDCHEGDSDIAIVFGCREERLSIRIVNPLHAAHAANPGVGLGLRTTAARLRLAYGDAASLQVAPEQGRFVVTLLLPRYGAG